MSKPTGRRRLAAALAVSAVLTAGCAARVDAADLPGLYRDKESGGEIRLDPDGTFTATDLTTDPDTDPEDLHGTWEFVDSSGSDFVYLDIAERGIGEVSGVQLYTRGGGKVAFTDPDGSWSLTLTRTTEQ
ncbi:hypothetical protein ACWD4X_32090 [Streptomyces termitum]